MTYLLCTRKYKRYQIHEKTVGVSQYFGGIYNVLIEKWSKEDIKMAKTLGLEMRQNFDRLYDANGNSYSIENICNKREYFYWFQN